MENIVCLYTLFQSLIYLIYLSLMIGKRSPLCFQNKEEEEEKKIDETKLGTYFAHIYLLN